MKKGISPLIAAVLLVAFTMSVAGLMAAWGTTFTQTNLESLECSNALEISSADFENQNITLRLRNKDAGTVITNMTMSVIYKDVSNNSEDVHITNPAYTTSDIRVVVAAAYDFNASTATTTKVDTFNTIKPENVEITYSGCRQPVTRNL
jgi:flagellin-like protein